MFKNRASHEVSRDSEPKTRTTAARRIRRRAIAVRTIYGGSVFDLHVGVPEPIRLGVTLEAAVACASSDRPVPTTEPSAQLQPSPPVESARREPDWSPGWSRRDAPLMDPVSTREPAAGGATAAVLAKEADRRTHHVDAPRSSAWQRGSEPVQRATESAPRSRRGHPVVVHSTSSAALQRRQASLCGSPEGTSHTCSLV